MSPKHSIDFCPICGGGLCGIRICGVDDDGANSKINSDNTGETPSRFFATGSAEPHGLIVCDECEAIWLMPDVTTPHQYPVIQSDQGSSASNDSDESSSEKCPICHLPLWGRQSRWADSEDVEALGWQFAVNPDLDVNLDEGTV